jgi:hypothetical protein
MRIFDWKGNRRLRTVALYLTAREAQEMLEFLEHAVANPHAEDHTHVWSKGMKDELSFEIITQRKLKSGDYSPTVRRLCRGWVDEPVRRTRRR